MSMTLKQQVDYWLSGANESLLDMRAAIRSGRRANGLFCGHLALEKMLKAVCAVRLVPIDKIWGHKLHILAKEAGIKLSNSQLNELLTITTFNIEARYSSRKEQFKAICTPQYVKQWSQVIEQWCKELKECVLNERALLPNKKRVN